MNADDYAIEKWGAVKKDEVAQDNLMEFCCQEMADLVAWSDGVIDLADTVQEFEEMTRDPDHVELRRQIAAHKCLPEFARTVAEKNPALAAKWMESYSGGE